jgi:hypothetical protein
MMKISKTRLKEIIKEELSTVRESDWYDDENETRADRKYADRDAGLGDPAEETSLNSPREAGRQWEAAKMNLTTAATAALEDGLSPRDIRNAIEEILSSAPDEGPRLTSTGPWAPEYRDK